MDLAVFGLVFVLVFLELALLLVFLLVLAERRFFSVVVVFALVGLAPVLLEQQEPVVLGPEVQVGSALAELALVVVLELEA